MATQPETEANGSTASNGDSNGSSSNGASASTGKNGGHRPVRDASAIRKLVECALVSFLPLFWNHVLQVSDPTCNVSRFVSNTMLAYGILYGILRLFGGLLQPSLSVWLVGSDTTTMNEADLQAERLRLASEWRARLLAIVNASLLSVGSFLCFAEWPRYDPPSEGWIKRIDIRIDCFSSHPVVFASLFVGYLQWDLCWLVWHRRSHPDLGSLIHHTIFIAVTHFVLWGTYFRKPFAWLSLTEVSTPLLHLRWFLAATGKKESILYVGTSVGFALAFLSTRVVGYGLGLVDLWRSCDDWRECNGLWRVVIGLHLAYGLNLFWSVKVFSALVRAVTGKPSRSSKPKPKQQ